MYKVPHLYCIGQRCNTIPETGAEITNCTSGVLGFGREADQCILKHNDSYSELWTCEPSRNWSITLSKYIYNVYIQCVYTVCTYSVCVSVWASI